MRHSQRPQPDQVATPESPLIQQFFERLDGHDPDIIAGLGEAGYKAAIAEPIVSLIKGAKHPARLREAMSRFVAVQCAFTPQQSALTEVGRAVSELLADFYGSLWSDAQAQRATLLYLDSVMVHYKRGQRPGKGHTPLQRSGANHAFHLSRPQRARDATTPIVSVRRSGRVIPLAIERPQCGPLLPHRLLKVIFSLEISHWTGRLRLERPGELVEVDFLDGAPGCFDGDFEGQRRGFLRAFGWGSGGFTCLPAHAGAQSLFLGFGKPFEVLLEGALNHARVDSLERFLEPWAHHHLVLTEQGLERIAARDRGDDLRRLCESCDGQRHLDALVRAIWSIPDVEALLAFAIATHMVVPQPTATAAPLRIHYTNVRARSRADTPTRERRRRTTGERGTLETAPIQRCSVG